MKIDKSKNHLILEFNNGFIFEIWECLSEIIFWKRFNWNTWQFINIEFENDIMMGGYEFTFVLLCCGIRIRIPHETKKSKKEWNKIHNSMKKLEESCYGWVNKEDYERYRNKKADQIYVVEKKRKHYTKKIFIQ